MVKRIMVGIPVDDASMALDVIDEVGPGGHYLEHDHTFDRFRKGIWRPKLLDRQNFENWEASGSKTHRERVNARVIEILEDEEPLLEDTMLKELRRVCELADERHKDEELDFEMFG
jgi:trimethylamine--corrinoid protein Co-methyltransferase